MSFFVKHGKDTPDQGPELMRMALAGSLTVANSMSVGGLHPTYYTGGSQSTIDYIMMTDPAELVSFHVVTRLGRKIQNNKMAIANLDHVPTYIHITESGMLLSQML